jgi:hypothetical protein
LTSSLRRTIPPGRSRAAAHERLLRKPIQHLPHQSLGCIRLRLQQHRASASVDVMAFFGMPPIIP